MYGRVYSLDEVKISIEWQMKKVWTDYIGHVFIHCIDGLDAPFDEWGDGAVDYILKLKDDGTVHHVGLSTHIPEMAMRTLDSGIVDMMMFSINSAYDYRRGEFAFGDVDERTFLYGRCQVEGVEISVMKAFSGGQLTNVVISPFRRALTAAQCIQYALERPGVVTVLPGVRNMDDLKSALSHWALPPRRGTTRSSAPSPLGRRGEGRLL